VYRVLLRNWMATKWTGKNIMGPVQF